MSDFTDRLAEAMRIRGINQTTLSSMTDIPKSAISQYLSGHFKPRTERTNVICRALNVRPAWLLGLENDSPFKMRKESIHLTRNERKLIEEYRNNPSFKKNIDSLLCDSKEAESVFRAAKSDGGNVPPMYEAMSAENLKKLAEAPETDEDI